MKSTTLIIPTCCLLALLGLSVANASIIEVAPNSLVRIIGERQADADPLGYYTGTAKSPVGTSGASDSRTDTNVVFGFTLPTLAPGEFITEVSFDFEITGGRNSAGSIPNLAVYLLDVANPDGSGTTWFYQGGSDPNLSVELVGVTNATWTGTEQFNFSDDTEDRSMVLVGPALALLQSFYGGDHVSDQSEVFFRFNLDIDPTLSKFRRYNVDLASSESSLSLTTAVPEPSTYGLLGLILFACIGCRKLAARE